MLQELQETQQELNVIKQQSKETAQDLEQLNQHVTKLETATVKLKADTELANAWILREMKMTERAF